MYDDGDCPPENDGYEIPNKPDWNKTQPTPPANSSKASDSVTANKTEVNGGSFKSTNELTTIENILRDSSTFSEKENSGFTDECLRK